MNREELIKKLQEIWTWDSPIQATADFILEDRKRICEPLIELKKEWGWKGPKGRSDAIDETLKLAGFGG